MKASIIICNWNQEKYIARAIRSALAQASSFPKNQYEIIVVDDGSTDHSMTAIHSFDDCIKIIALPENKGLANALNVGIQNALGEYIARVDADDMLRHNFLVILSEFLDYNKQYDWVKSDYLVIDDHENTMERGSEELACCFLFRKRALEAVGLYNDTLRINETRDILIRLLQDPRYKESGAHIKIPLYKWFRHKGSLTNGGKKGMV